MKDRFSEQADAYRTFRPEYPPELFQFIFSQLSSFGAAWDCGTGNGQVAVPLSGQFIKVVATDISEKQLAHAQQRSNIEYRLLPAEKTDFSANTFDLITVAQAIHWFKFDQFYEEVRRVSKPGALLAVIGYGLLKTDDDIQDILEKFYVGTLGGYWDAERHYIDECYQTIPFPFLEIKSPNFEMKYNWTVEQFLGYLSTWSACKNYESTNGSNPIDLVRQEIISAWGSQKRDVVFPNLFRLGKI